MSVLIGEKKGTIVEYHPVFIKSNGHSEFTSSANHIFDILINFKFLTYMFDQKCFIINTSQLSKLLMFLDHEEIRYQIEDTCDEKFQNLKIDEQEVPCPPSSYSTHAKSPYKAPKMPKFHQMPEKPYAYQPYPHHDRPYQDKKKDFSKGKWESKVKEETIVQLNEIDENTMAVRFEPFDDHVLHLIKEVEGRVWIKDDKAWHIPAAESNGLLEKLRKHSFSYQIHHL